MALLLAVIAAPLLPRRICSIGTAGSQSTVTSASAPASAASRCFGKERCLWSEALLSLKVCLSGEKLFDNLRWRRLDIRFIAHYLQKDLPVICSRNTIHKKACSLSAMPSRRPQWQVIVVVPAAAPRLNDMTCSSMLAT